MKKVSIIGSGNVGVNSAFFIAENGSANVMLVDIVPGIASGKALDLMEAAPIRRYRTRIGSSQDIAAIEGSDVVVIAAGQVRKSGQRRMAVFEENSKLVRGICEDIVRYAPNSVIIISPEPVDGIVKVVNTATGMDRRRILGIGGVLDSTRMAHFVAQELNLSDRGITSMVVGSHTEAMVPLPYYTRVNGIPVTQLLDPERVRIICKKTREAGRVILELSQRSSAYYAPSSAIAMVTEAVCLDLKRICSVSVLLEGEYGFNDLALSVPCRIGSGGVDQILELDLSEGDRESIRESAEVIRDLV